MAQSHERNNEAIIALQSALTEIKCWLQHAISAQEHEIGFRICSGGDSIKNEDGEPVTSESHVTSNISSDILLIDDYNDEDSESDSCEIIEDSYYETDEFDCDDDDDDGYEKLKKFLKTIHSLNYYPPSEALRAAQATDFSDVAIASLDANGVYGDYLKSQQLTSKNVVKLLQLMLSIEDLTSMTEYTTLALKDSVLLDAGKRTYSVTLQNSTLNAKNILNPFMDDVVLIPKASMQASEPVKDVIETLFPHCHERTKEINLKRHVASIEEVTRERVTFMFDKDSFPGVQLIKQRYDVVFRPRRLPLRFQYRALDLLEQDALMRSYLFPCDSNPFKKDPVFANLTLINGTIASNVEQLQAVRHIVEGPNRYAPYVIFGPPGTGKTTTIVEAILQLRLQKPRSRILVTAGSNSACDTIALRICEYLTSSQQLKHHIAQQQKQPTIYTMDVAADHQLIRIYSKSAYKKSMNTISPLLIKHSNCQGGQHNPMPVDIIRQYGIVVATLCSVGMHVTSNIGKFNFFTHVFIDEAGASSEPETLVGIMGIKTDAECRIVLCGDHKQLGPVLKSDRAAKLGLEQSMMERLLKHHACYKVDRNGNYDHTLQTRLRRNYRSNSEIVRLYNHLYYNNELIACAKSVDVNLASNWHILPNSSFPIIFQAAHGKLQHGGNSPSSYNILEVDQVMWYVRRLLRDGINGCDVKQKDIGVITPYRAQCERIAAEMLDHCFWEVDVGSVEMFQGQEKPIIIVSFVRSFSSLGFVRNPRRLNVILSRAKSLLLLIGNPITLRKNADFRFLINECVQKKTFLCKKRESGNNKEMPKGSKQTSEHIERETNQSGSDLAIEAVSRVHELSEQQVTCDNESLRVTTAFVTVQTNLGQTICIKQENIDSSEKEKEVTNLSLLDDNSTGSCSNISDNELETNSTGISEIIKPKMEAESPNEIQNRTTTVATPSDSCVAGVYTNAKILQLFTKQAKILQNIKQSIFEQNDSEYVEYSECDQQKIFEMITEHARLVSNIENNISKDKSHQSSDLLNLLDRIIVLAQSVHKIKSELTLLDSAKPEQRCYTKAVLLKLNPQQRTSHLVDSSENLLKNENNFKKEKCDFIKSQFVLKKSISNEILRACSNCPVS